MRASPAGSAGASLSRWNYIASNANSRRPAPEKSFTSPVTVFQRLPAECGFFPTSWSGLGIQFDPKEETP